MIVAVLGGMGLQGRAALLDLTRSKGVEKVLCADAVLSGDLGKIEKFIDRSKVEMVKMDGSSKPDIVRVLKKGADVAICCRSSSCLWPLRPPLKPEYPW
jgi:lysine 6-dehydrogenase